jgi:diguanylate cyclase (GGDEF)-like protein
LVVDDDEDVREMLQYAVSMLGHDCLVAADGRQALALQRAQRVDVILSDWCMPEMSGIELCQRVRARPTPEYTCFVFMTALTDRAHVLEALRAGADYYLTKPIDLEQLEARLSSAVRVIGGQQRLRNEARVDPLTQAGNRLRLREDLCELQARITRYGHRYSVAMCDVDLFKKYNDTHGHVLADEALRCIAGTIRSALRQGDSLYRYGGEEFLVILPEQTLDEARRAMERVCRAVADLRLPDLDSPKGNVTLSIGIAEMEDLSDDEWLRRADTALYRAKRAGRNRVAVVEPTPTHH